MLAYLRGAHWSISALLFVLAVATRETAVTLPAALLLCELCRAERPAWREILRRQWPHWALLLAGGVFVLLNQRYFDLIAYGYGERSLADNLLTQVGGISYLVLRLISLHGYNIDPALPTLTEWTPMLVFQVMLLLFPVRAGRQPTCARARGSRSASCGSSCSSRRPTRSCRGSTWRTTGSSTSRRWGLFLALCIQLRNLPKFAFRSDARPFRRRQRRCASSTTAARSCSGNRASRWRRGMRAGTTTSATPTSSPGAREDARREYQAALLFDPRHAKARLNLHFLKD